ncbi:MAG: poly(A) polymerase [Paracoccaceae bacterium]
MKISASWLTHVETQHLAGALMTAGFQAVFVGGCVRNALLNEPINDIDLATDAVPNQIIACAKNAGFHSVPTGIEHGTVTVLAGETPIEVTTFRKDIATDGRHATVAFSTEISDDAARRDFTINAIYAQSDGTIIDPLGGLSDLEARRVRFIGSAQDRIREDYLRILRFFRFHAWYADAAEGLDPDGLAACASLADGLDRLAKERVGAEIMKLLGATDPAPAVAAMAQTGVLARILSGAVATGLPVLVHWEGTLGVSPDPVRRLACLGGQDPDAALRLSTKQAKRYAQLRMAIGSTQSIAVLGYQIGATGAVDVALLRSSLLEQPLALTTKAEADLGAAAEFPVRAADLMPQMTGPALGAHLKALEARWIASGFVLSRDDLLS